MIFTNLDKTHITFAESKENYKIPSTANTVRESHTTLDTTKMWITVSTFVNQFA